MSAQQIPVTESETAPASGGWLDMWRSLLGGIGGKVIALVILPSLFVSAIGMFNMYRTSGMVETMLEVRESVDSHDRAIYAASDTVRSEMANILRASAAMTQAHHRSLMAEDRTSTAAASEARDVIGRSVIWIRNSVKPLATALLNKQQHELENGRGTPPPVVDSAAELSQEDRRRLFSITRLSNTLPHLFGIFTEANDRTIALIESEDFVAANANFIYEEEARLSALTRVLADLSINLDLLSKSLRERASAGHEEATEEIFSAMAVMSRETHMMLAGFTFLLILAAVWFAVRGLVLPLRRIASAMNHLGAGETDVAMPRPGKDEFGEMARALAVFRLTLVEAVRAKVGLDCVSMGVTITNSRGVFVYANKSAQDIFARLEAPDHRAVLNDEFSSAARHDLEGFLNRIGTEGLELTTLKTRKSYEFEVAGRTLSVVADPVVDRYGRSLGSVVGWDDITERKKDEEKISRLNADLEQRVLERTSRLSEMNNAMEIEIYERGQANVALEDAKSHLGAIMTNLADGLITIDDTGTIDSVNPALEKIFGYSETDLLGKNVSILMSKQESDRHRGYVESYLASGVGKIIGTGAREVTGKRKDGSEFAMDLAISETRVEGRCRFIGLIRDVTDRKKDQADLLARTYQQETVVELGQHALAGGDLPMLFHQAAVLVAMTLDVECCAIYEHREQGNHLLLCAGVGWKPEVVGQATLSVNTHTCAGLALTTGRPVVIDDLAIDKRFNDSNHLLSSHDIVSAIGVVIRGRDHDFGVLEAHRRRFEPFTEEDIAFLQAVAHTLSTAIERKRAEDEHKQLIRQLYHSQKMDAIGQLAGGVAHDFNNILMIIEGYTMRARNDPKIPDEAMISLDHVITASRKAAGLTKQLLAFSSRQHLETTVVAVAEVMAEVEALLDPLLGETIDLRCSVTDTQVIVETDAAQLSQAIINLAINARDAMPRGGRISITADRIVADKGLLDRNPKLAPGAYSRIMVTDGGEGMDADTLASIFDPFFTTKQQGKGTGLGLAMVYGFLDQCGGAVEVVSEPGQGATFSIYLPVTDKPAMIETIDAETNLKGNGETILLAEDDETLRGLVSFTLRELGYTVIAASDGFEALEVEAEHENSIDLLLSDVVMPNLGGFELARALRETRPDIKVLFMSGYPSRGDIKSTDLPDDIPLLPKPCSREQLARAVRDVLVTREVS